VPIVVFFLTRRLCDSLARRHAHPLRAWQGAIVRRMPDGSIRVVGQSPDRLEAEVTEPPVGTVPGHEPEEGS
jgi:hypothetical protein